MKTLFLLMAISISSFGNVPPAPSGCRWEKIKEVNGRIAVPEYWKFKSIPAKGKTIYEVVPAGPEIGGSAKSKYKMEILKSLPNDSVVSMAKEFVQSARRKKTTDVQPMQEQQFGKMKLFSLVVQYPSELLEGYRRSVARSASANEATGTLVSMELDIPENEIGKVAPMGNLLIQTMVLDDDY
jgi:hypothetical protein